MLTEGADRAGRPGRVNGDVDRRRSGGGARGPGRCGGPPGIWAAGLDSRHRWGEAQGVREVHGSMAASNSDGVPCYL